MFTWSGPRPLRREVAQPPSLLALAPLGAIRGEMTDQHDPGPAVGGCFRGQVLGVVIRRPGQRASHSLPPASARIRGRQDQPVRP